MNQGMMWNVIIGVMTISVPAIFLYFAAVLRAQNAKFKNAKKIDGRIIELHHAPKGNGHFPVVQYTYLGESNTFKNKMSIQGAKVGQLLSVEIAGDGSARVDTVGNQFVPKLMIFLAIAAFVFGLVMIGKGGF